MSTWLQILPIVVAVLVACISYFQARKAIRISRDAIAQAKNANELAEKAIAESKIQFTTINRPLLIIKPVSFKKDNIYFDINFLDEKKLIIKIPIEIKNLGNLVADNTFLHSANCMLHIN